MTTKADVIRQAHACGFADIGFTTVATFDAHRQQLNERQADYGWVARMGLNLARGSDPLAVMPEARTLIVLIEPYLRHRFPRRLEAHFGRCYLDDDRITKKGLAVRFKAFRGWLRDRGIASKSGMHMPHRAAAARAGLGTLGKNCLFYSRKAVRQGSWILPLTLLVDHAFAPDAPTFRMGCPDWCRNACVAACPTRALKGDGTLDPRKCISYLSYYGEGLTPRALREPMGLYVYGCDRCQDVCPRNAPWLALDLPVHPEAAVMEADFALKRLLHMDQDYFKTRIWPRMFYMPAEQIWRWRMNAARAMGNTRDERYVDDLARAAEDTAVDERVRAMAVWALGRIGGPRADAVLARLRPAAAGLLLEEFAQSDQGRG